jgi:phosphatidylserine decarboxylase
MPFDAEVVGIERRPGRFLAASDKRAPIENERVIHRMKSSRGQIIVTLIAGLVARRIKSFADERQLIKRGAEFAMIYFGSRVDVTLPADFEIIVKEGQYVKAGTSPIARLIER